MRASVALGALALVLTVCSLGAADEKAGVAEQPAAAKQAAPGAAADWAMNATIIEACSCPMFCQCYFTTKPAAHSGK